MSVEVRCGCGYSFAAAEAARGRTVPCLSCGKPLLIGGGGPRAFRRTVGPGVTLEVIASRRFAAMAETVLELVARRAVDAPEAIAWVGAFPLTTIQVRDGGTKRRIVEADLEQGGAPRESPTLDELLGLLALTAKVHDAAEVPPEDYNLTQLVRTHKGALTTRRVVLEHRFDRAPVPELKTQDTGWYLGPDPSPDVDADPPEAVQHVRLFELRWTRPAACALIGLPKGCVARLDGGVLLEVVDARARVLWAPAPD